MKAGAFARRSRLPVDVVPFVAPEETQGVGAGPAMTMPAPAAKPEAPRRGLFGRMGNALSRVDWERVFAAMRTDPSHMQSLLETRENAAERMRAEAEAEAERRQGKQVNADLEAIISSLPEDQRDRARLLSRISPENFAERHLGAGDPQSPHYDSASGTFWIEDPEAPNGYRILGRNPNWQPPAPLVQYSMGADASGGGWNHGPPPPSALTTPGQGRR